MDMLTNEQIAAAGLVEWRKLAQGLHTRFVVEDFRTATRLLQSVCELGGTVDDHLRVRIGPHYVDFEVVSDDAVYRDDEGTEHVVEWVTQQDVDLARHITEIAAAHGVRADPSAVSELELGLDTVASEDIAPVWAALLTGDAQSRGRGTPGDEIRDSTGRVPNLWFGDEPNHDVAQRFHVEVYVAAEVVEQRIADTVAAGGTIVDDSQSPGLTVIADPAGNRGVVCAAAPPAKQG